MAEREAEVRADYARVRDGHGGCQEDVGALLEILDAERALRTELPEAADQIRDALKMLERVDGSTDLIESALTEALDILMGRR